jgi:DNA polymerase V
MQNPPFRSSKSVNLFTGEVTAGFPSPAEDFDKIKIDLNKIFIKKPLSTFLVKSVGDSMINAGIFSGDTLIVDRSLKPQHNLVVVAYMGGGFCVKRLITKAGRSYLFSENPKYKPVDISDREDVQIWGVVTYVIHNPNICSG